MVNPAGKILLVEDEDAILFAFKKVLSAPTVAVDTAQTLEEARSYLQQNEYSAVIADLRLSDATTIEGFEVIRETKERQANCTIIVLTAYGKSDTREKVFELGANYYLEKPVSPQKIKEMLQHLQILPQ
jgi:DNA-binding response OmpR family regulator